MKTQALQIAAFKSHYAFSMRSDVALKVILFVAILCCINIIGLM